MGEILHEKSGEFAICQLIDDSQGDIYYTIFYNAKRLYEGSKSECLDYAKEKEFKIGKDYVLMPNFNELTKHLNEGDYKKVIKESKRLMKDL